MIGYLDTAVANNYYSSCSIVHDNNLLIHIITTAAPSFLLPLHRSYRWTKLINIPRLIFSSDKLKRLSYNLHPRILLLLVPLLFGQFGVFQKSDFNPCPTF